LAQFNSHLWSTEVSANIAFKLPLVCRFLFGDNSRKEFKGGFLRNPSSWSWGRRRGKVGAVNGFLGGKSV
jgi:hypothetical protein